MIIIKRTDHTHFCSICGADLYGCNYVAKTCSEECSKELIARRGALRYASTRKTASNICPICHNTFQVSKLHRVYCSTPCEKEARYIQNRLLKGHSHIKTCCVCHATIPYVYDPLTGKSSSRRRTCSAACSQNAANMAKKRWKERYWSKPENRMKKRERASRYRATLKVALRAIEKLGITQDELENMI